MVVPCRAEDFVHWQLRRRARRPQLKRDPLGTFTQVLMQWLQLENRARAQLRSDLAQFGRLARATHDLIGAAVATGTRGRTDVPGHAARVQARLLLRLSHDLRVIELAAARSYSLQALSLAANIFELSHAVAYIGTSPQRAQAWERHQNTRQTYPSLRQRRDAIKATLSVANPGIPNIERAIDAQEKLYSVLCMAKHGNPIVLRGFGVTTAKDTTRFYHGPFVARYIVRQCRFALFQSARMAAAATMVFVAPLLDGAPLKIRRRYRTVERRVVRLLDALSPHALEPR